jgi:hypothetical protein
MNKKWKKMNRKFHLNQFIKKMLFYIENAIFL